MIWADLGIAVLLGAVWALRGEGEPRIDQGAAAFALSLATSVGLEAVWLFGLARPRLKWRNAHRYDAPAWLRLGWAPLALLILAASVAAPASLALTAVLGTAAAGAAVWAFITGQEDASERGVAWALPGYLSLFTLAFYVTAPLWRPNLKFHPTVRTIFAFAYLGVFWLLLRPETAEAAWRQMSLPLAGAAAAFAVGSDSLFEAWVDEVAERVRRIALVGLAVGAAAAPFLLWWASPGPALVPLAAATVAALVLLHKVPSQGLANQPYLIRDLIMRYGWVLWWFVALYAESEHGQGALVLLFGGMWLLTGVATTAVGALRQARQ